MYARNQIETIDDLQTLRNLAQATVKATYRPDEAEEFFDRLSARYLKLQRRGKAFLLPSQKHFNLMQLSEMQGTMTYFGLECPSFSTKYY